MYGAGITDDSRLIERALNTIRKFMEDDGQSFSYQRFIAPASGTASFARALSRSVTGSMNELVLAASNSLQMDEVAPVVKDTFNYMAHGTQGSVRSSERWRRHGWVLR